MDSTPFLPQQPIHTSPRFPVAHLYQILLCDRISHTFGAKAGSAGGNEKALWVKIWKSYVLPSTIERSKISPCQRGSSPRIDISPITTLWMEDLLAFQNPRNRSGVSQMKRIPPSGSLRQQLTMSPYCLFGHIQVQI